MKHNKINSRKGFTLVEMLGVLAIIAILISVISVGVLSAINRARIISTVSNFKNLETATLAYLALSESSGRLPLTKAATHDTVVDTTAAAAAGTALNADTDLHLEIIFLAAGTLERYPNWRVGVDGVQNGAQLNKERAWNRRKNKWTELNVDGTAAGVTNNWTQWVRAECAAAGPNTLVPGTYNANGTMNADKEVNFRIDGFSNLVKGSRVAYVVIPGLTMKDAEKISEEINGALNEMDLKAATPLVTQQKGRFVVDGATTQNGDVTGYYFLANL
ncbi:type II secretion system protein [Ereboglobus luteus]|uniref:Prepilin-type cleavage/methylation domain-containing protein n=1 Tax=Ereboglobus luteus TaxID=1796921 RepID=A0A2U8E0V7_9BACT|nr:type II secretion system protein [Ereboglobus luteus]AWI08478.1 hypothetical protein CKA38_03725 [Ereboglobus luteus]